MTARGLRGYTEGGTGLRKSVTFDPISFIGKVLPHFLPARFHGGRYFGWLPPRCTHQASIMLRKMLCVWTATASDILERVKCDRRKLPNLQSV
jgi:hypothetical protein